MPAPLGHRCAAAVTAAAALLITGCAAPAAPAAEPGAGPAGTAAERHSYYGISAGDLPSRHVHAVAVDPGSGDVLLATHDGLFRGDGAGWQPVGPVMDLMGFAVAGPGRYYASGYPAPGAATLPDPVGLLETTDGGATWTPRSRQGESDFHALAASAAGVVGFDGELRATTDGAAWRTLPPPAPGAAVTGVAASPDGQVLVVVTELGVLARSTDGGATWADVAAAPTAVLAWTGPIRVVAVAMDGAVSVSDDSGVTWRAAGAVEAAPQAVGGDAEVIVVVTASTTLQSADGGATFTPLPPVN